MVELFKLKHGNSKHVFLFIFQESLLQCYRLIIKKGREILFCMFSVFEGLADQLMRLQ